MKRKWYTKALSLILSISMTMSLIPTTAFASGSSDSLEDLYAEIESLCANSAEETSESYEVTSSVTLEPVICSEDEALSDTDTSATESTETAETDAITPESTETAESAETAEANETADTDTSATESTESVETDTTAAAAVVADTAETDAASADETSGSDASADTGILLASDESDFSYTVVTDSDGSQTASITGYSGSDTELVIPATIDGYAVTAIGASAFYGNTELTSVEIPEGVVSIGGYAFKDCTALETVDIPSTLTSLAYHAFYNCSALTEITLPEGLTEIEGHTFYNCTSLTKVDLPESLTAIASYAFSGCSGLREINLPDGLTAINDGTFSGCSSLTDITIPDTVETIGSWAFGACSSLESVTLPQNLTGIGTYAFTQCTMLTSVTLQDQLTTIGDYAFYQSTGLTEIAFPESLTTICRYAFSECSGLESIVFSEGLTSIGEFAFSNCSSLENVTLPGSLTYIGQGAFSDCTGMTSAVVSEGVTELVYLLFQNCSALVSVELPESLIDMDGAAFYGCTSLTDIRIPSGITELNGSDFYNCSSLKSIELPEGLTWIGPSVFYGCSSLETIDLPSTLTHLGDYVFYNCTALKSITIPEGITDIPKYAFCYCSSLEDVNLPSTLTAIWDYAFRQCSSLIRVKIPEGVTIIYGYAFYYCTALEEVIIPYTVTTIYGQRNTFYSPYGKLVLVVTPDSYAEQYAIDCIINYSYISTASSVLNVEIGSEEDWDAYSGLSLTVASENESITYRTTNKTSYRFSELSAADTWTVTLTNAYGDVLGYAEPELVGGEETTVTLEGLTAVTDVGLEVLDASGSDVSSQVTAKWYLEDGTLYADSSSLKCVPVGLQLACQVTLNKALALEYRTPEMATCEVSAENPTVSVSLESFSRIILTGTVTDADGKAISGASVTAAQTLNGKYEKKSVTQTGTAGTFELEIFTEAAELSIAANGYSTATLSLEAMTENCELETISLEELTGATVTLTAAYYTATEEGPISATWSSWKDVYVTAVNDTTGETLSTPILQNNVLTFTDGVNEGDSLTLSVSSLSDEFVPVEVTAKMDENLTASVTLTLIEYGRIAFSFGETENDSVRALVYDESGALVWENVFANGDTGESDPLAAGEYTVVVMGEEKLITSPVSLTALANAGFEEETDYVCSAVSVKDGTIADVSFDSVPLLDSSKFLFTDPDETVFVSNKTSVSAGNYFTLRAQTAFKSEYADRVSDIKWIFEYPESCEYVSGTLTSNNQTISNVSQDATSVSVSVEDPSELIRLCMIEGEGGTTRIDAYLEFTLDGETVVRQSVGMVTVEVDALTFTMVEKTNFTTVQASGTASPGATICVYDNDVLVEQTTADGNGNWSTPFELYKPYTHSTHVVYIEAITVDGLSMRTATRTIEYEYPGMTMSNITVTMLAMKTSGEQYEYTIDFLSGTNSLGITYDHFEGSTITYLVSIDCEDISRISNVQLILVASDGAETVLYPVLDEETGIWSIAESFGASGVFTPVRIDVRYDVESTLTISREEMDEKQAEIESAESELDAALEELAALDESEEEEIQAWLEADLESLDLTEEEYATLISLSADSEFTEEDMEALAEELSEEEYTLLSEFMNDLDEQLEQDTYEELVDSLTDEINEAFQDYQDSQGTITTTENGYVQESASSTQSVEYLNCDSITAEELLADGYTEYATTSGSPIYMKYDAASGKYYYVDFDSDQWVIIAASEVETDLDSGTETVSAADIMAVSSVASSGSSGSKESALNAVNSISDFCDQVDIALSAFEAAFENAKESKLAEYNSLKKGEAVASELCYKQIKYQMESNNLESAARYAKYLVSRGNKMSSLSSMVSNLSKAAKVLGACGTLFGVCGIAADVSELMGICSLFDDIDNAIGECVNSEHISIANELRTQLGWYITGKISLIVANLASMFAKLSALIPGIGWVTAGIVTLGVGVTSFLIGENLDNWFNAEFYTDLKQLITNCKACTCKVCKDMPPEDDESQGEYGLAGPRIKYKYDPSGYVYEAVDSNRLEGVTATVYQQVEGEDIYGDPIPVTEFWDAEEYGEVNPQTTDALGQYGWDVPEGLWQVKYEKTGYETAYSDWLEVLPVHTDVNIGLVSYEQPTVTSCEVYTDQITLTFSKYMSTDGLADAITVTVNGETVSGTLNLDDGEANPENEDEIFASQVSFIPDETIAEGAEVTVTVTDDACSYADMCLKAAYEETASAAQRPETMTVTESLTLAYGGTGTIEIQVLPASASAGKTVTVDTLSSILISVEEESVTLDENGCATVEVKGLLPGASQISFGLDGTTLKTTASVTVQNKSASTECTHDLTHHEASATCTTDGTIEYWSCSVCGKNFSDEAAENEVTDLTLSATGHTLTYHAATATCTAGGTIAYYSCSVCGKNFSDAAGQNEVTTITASAKGHTLTYHAAVAATCTKSGTIAYYSCSVCGKNFSDAAGTKQVTSVTTAATGHSYGAWTTKTEATVFAAETQVHTCSKCGATETRSYGSALTPTIKVNASSIKLKVKQSTSALKVTGLANGDSVVSWKSSNKKIVTVNSKGKITAKNKTGKATITITLASGKTKKITVTVQKTAVKTTKISGLSKTVTLKKGKKTTLKPVITPITSLQKVTYSSSNKKVATVNSKGVITAKKAGTAKITVKSGSKKFVVTVKVKK